MKRSGGLNINDLKARNINHLYDQPHVEDMMMGASVRIIIQYPLFKVLSGRLQGIEPEIMQFEDLAEVCFVAFIHLLMAVLDDVLEARDRAAMVERSVPVWKHQCQGAAVLEDSCPSAECSQRIGRVFQHVR